jgi:hypothetical protein
VGAKGGEPYPPFGGFSFVHVKEDTMEFRPDVRPVPKVRIDRDRQTLNDCEWHIYENGGYLQTEANPETRPTRKRLVNVMWRR